MNLKDFINEQLDPLRPEDEAENLEERLNREIRQFGMPAERLWVDVDEGRREIQVYILSDDMIPIDQVNAIARFIRDTARAELVGLSGGSQHSIYLHFKL